MAKTNNNKKTTQSTTAAPTVKKSVKKKSTIPPEFKLNKESQKGLEALAELTEKNRKREYQDSLKQFDLEKQLYELKKEAADIPKNAIKYHQDISKYLQDEKKLEEQKLKILKSGKKFDDNEYKLLKKDLTLKKEAARISLNNLTNQKRINKLNQAQAPLIDKAYKAQNALTERNEKYKQGLVSSLGFLDEIDDSLNEIPIVGGILSAALGLDNIKELMTESILDMFNGKDKAAQEEAEAAAKALQDEYDSEIKTADDLSKERQRIFAEEEYNNKLASLERVDEVKEHSIAAIHEVAALSAGSTPSQEVTADPAQTEMDFGSEDAVQASQEITDSMSNTNDAILETESSLTNIERKLKASSSTIDSLNGAVDDTKIGFEDAGEAAEGMKGGLKGAESAASKLKKALGPMALIAAAIGAAIALFKHGLEVDQEVTDMARGLGISKDNAEELHHTFKEIAITSKVIGANSKALGEAYMELTALTGQNTVANKKMLETNVLLTKQYGMQASEAAQFQLMSVGTGKTSEQVLGTVRNMTESYNKMTGDSLNFKEITKDIAKATKSQLATYKGNVAQLTKAVIQAKKLGITLETASAISANLLDFESSIENEMKANVLTGKSMNMNAARQLALQGDIAGAAAAALEQAGSYDEFMEMEMYQKEAIAKAAGMTVDQMVEAGQLQKMSVALGGKQIKNMSELTEADRQALLKSGDLNEEEAAKLALQAQQISAQEKMNETINKMKEAFGAIADGPLGSIANFLVSILSHSEALIPIIGGIALVMGALAIKSAMVAIAALSSAAAWTLGIGLAAVAAGIVVASVAMANESDKAVAKVDAAKGESVSDAQIAPDGGLMVSGEKGTYQLHKDDSIIAGTDLGSISNPPMNDSNTTSNTPNNSNNGSSEVVALLKELIKKIDQPVQFNIGGKTIQEIDKVISVNRSYTSSDNNYSG